MIDVSSTPRPAGALPAGTPAPKTAQERALWDQVAGLEAVFAQHLVREMLDSARGESESGANGAYQQMADEQLTKSFVESGSLGLAGAVYAQLRRSQ